jgi:hypothetical protein
VAEREGRKNVGVMVNMLYASVIELLIAAYYLSLAGDRQYARAFVASALEGVRQVLEMLRE